MFPSLVDKIASELIALEVEQISSLFTEIRSKFQFSKGDGDYWLVKLDSKGTMLWQKSYGGSKADNLHCIIHKPLPDEYYLAGDSESGDGDFNNVFDGADFGIIKLKNPLTKTQDSTVCNINSFVAFTDTLKDVCGFDSMLVAYKPVIISRPLTNIKK